MTHKDQIATSILRPINPTLIIVLGIYTVLWGLWLINPFWTVFTATPVFSAMATLAPEWIWGVIAVFSGMLTIRGAVNGNYKSLQTGSLAGFFHWFIIGIMYLIGDWMNTGGITSLTFAIYCAIVWLNIKVNRHNYDRHYK